MINLKNICLILFFTQLSFAGELQQCHVPSDDGLHLGTFRSNHLDKYGWGFSIEGPIDGLSQHARQFNLIKKTHEVYGIGLHFEAKECEEFQTGNGVSCHKQVGNDTVILHVRYRDKEKYIHTYTVQLPPTFWVGFSLDRNHKELGWHFGPPNTAVLIAFGKLGRCLERKLGS